ncbi:MAG: DUF4178 domain-containing protein [Pseudomonadota bacterium]
MNCPNCGNALDWTLSITLMRDCPFCESTVVLDGEALRLAGERGAMLDAPSLLRIGEPTHLSGNNWTPVGHARFSYGPGWWDEYWCSDGAGEFRWISVDEGDIAIEEPVDIDIDIGTHLRRGDRIMVRRQSFTATEEEEATCIAVRGELPELLQIGETHRYVDFTGEHGGILTFEAWEGEHAWFAGRWISPWEVAGAH